MKRSLACGLTAVVLAFALACPAPAAWQPSKTVREIGAASATVKSSSGEAVSVEVTLVPKVGTDGAAEEVKASPEAYIKVTPHSETQAANAALDAKSPELRFAEKSGENTDTGLSYSDNEHVNLLYETVANSTSTTQFLEKVGGNLLEKVTEAVQTQTADSAEETVDEYVPAALFDVTASAGAAAALGTDGKVDVELEVPGVKGDTKLVAVHFLGGVENIETAREELNGDFANAILNYDAEILPSVVGDGKVTVTMTSFSPVMILTKAEAAPVAGAEATPEPGTEPPPAPEPEADNGSNGGLWAVIAAAAAVGACAATRKKTAAAAGKK